MTSEASQTGLCLTQSKPPHLYYLGDWTAHGVLVHIRRVSKKLVFFDLRLNPKLLLLSGAELPPGPAPCSPSEPFPHGEPSDANICGFLSVQAELAAVSELAEESSRGAAAPGVSGTGPLTGPLTGARVEHSKGLSERSGEGEGGLNLDLSSGMQSSAEQGGRAAGVLAGAEVRRHASEKVEVMLRCPLCADVRGQSARLRVGDVVHASGRYIERLDEPGRHPWLFLASHVAHVSRELRCITAVERPAPRHVAAYSETTTDGQQQEQQEQKQEREQEQPQQQEQQEHLQQEQQEQQQQQGQLEAAGKEQHGGSGEGTVLYRCHGQEVPCGCHEEGGETRSSLGATAGSLPAQSAPGASLDALAQLEHQTGIRSPSGSLDLKPKLESELGLGSKSGLGSDTGLGLGLGLCKYWLNTGQCSSGAACPFRHLAGQELVAARQGWIAARSLRRRVEFASLEDPLDPHAKASKSARAPLFADWLLATFGRAALASGRGVLDVAGGRGALSFALHAVRGVNATLVEPRDRKLSKTERKYMAANPSARLPPVIQAEFPVGFPEFPEFPVNPSACCVPPVTRAELSAVGDALPPVGEEGSSSVDWHSIIDASSCLVGLHPDEATEPIVRAAIVHKKAFAVVPCCVFPGLFPHRRVVEGGELKLVDTYDRFIAYLKALAEEAGARVDVGWLNVEGLRAQARGPLFFASWRSLRDSRRVPVT